MNCKITTAPDFDRDIKTLAKRYPSIRDDYKSFLEEIKSNPFTGTQLGPDQATITDKELKALLRKNGLI